MPDFGLSDLPKKINDATTIYGTNVGVPLLSTGLGALIKSQLNKVDEVAGDKLLEGPLRSDPISRKEALKAILREYPGLKMKFLSAGHVHVEPSTQTISLNKASPVAGSALLHEAGHIRSNRPMAARTISTLGHKLSPYQAITSAALFGSELGKDKEDRSLVLPSLVGGSALAMKLPHLIEEATASHHARAIAKAHGLPKPKGLNRAFMTHAIKPSTLLGALLAGGAGYGINKLSS